MRLQQWLVELHDTVEVVAIEELQLASLSEYDKIVLGASIRYGKHSREVYRLVAEQRAALEARPNAFFSVNLVARKPEKCGPDSNPYLRKFLRQIEWQPRMLDVFAGKVNYAIYRPLDRFIIRMIMRITGGPTDPETDIEYTDWSRVEAFARQVHEM